MIASNWCLIAGQNKKKTKKIEMRSSGGQGELIQKFSIFGALRPFWEIYLSLMGHSAKHTQKMGWIYELKIMWCLVGWEQKTKKKKE